MKFVEFKAENMSIEYNKKFPETSWDSEMLLTTKDFTVKRIEFQKSHNMKAIGFKWIFNEKNVEWGV